MKTEYYVVFGSVNNDDGICSLSFKEFISDVQYKLDQGWVLVGGPTCQTGKYDATYMQAMTLTYADGNEETIDRLTNKIKHLKERANGPQYEY